MKTRSLLALLLLASSFAWAAPLEPVNCNYDSLFALPSVGDTLWDQLDDPAGCAFTDQAFEAGYAGYDSEGADDFMVDHPAGWDIDALLTAGAQTIPGSNPFFVNHYFYADAGGLPGAVECSFAANSNFSSDGTGDLAVFFDRPCNLEQGKHWVSQQVRQDFNPLGQHYWAARYTANLSDAVFRNPGNAFGSGCSDWSPANTMCGMAGRDFLFELRGKPRSGGGVPAIGPLGIAFLLLTLGGGSAYVLGRRRRA